MESETSRSNNIPIVFRRLLPAVVPVILISSGYVDPGKWTASVEGGARFGFDLVAAMLVFNLAAILCQYLSARIGVVTGRDLAEVCVYIYFPISLLLLMSVPMTMIHENVCQFFPNFVFLSAFCNELLLLLKTGRND